MSYKDWSNQAAAAAAVPGQAHEQRLRSKRAKLGWRTHDAVNEPLSVRISIPSVSTSCSSAHHLPLRLFFPVVAVSEAKSSKSASAVWNSLNLHKQLNYVICLYHSYISSISLYHVISKNGKVRRGRPEWQNRCFFEVETPFF